MEDQELFSVLRLERSPCPPASPTLSPSRWVRDGHMPPSGDATSGQAVPDVSIMEATGVAEGDSSQPLNLLWLSPKAGTFSCLCLSALVVPHS